jgi:hypothetical protein
MLGEHERPRPGIPGDGIGDGYQELSRLIAAEIDALDENAPVMDGPARPARRRFDPPRGEPFRHEAATTNAAEDEFIELVAAWLCRRPARRQLLRRLSAMVLPEEAMAPQAVAADSAPEAAGDEEAALRPPAGDGAANSPPPEA